MDAKPKTKIVWSWALYDWANSAFATTVMAGFFPLFFKAYWSTGFGAIESTYILGLANSMASLLIAVTSPALGAIADEGAYRKRLLFFFTVIGSLSAAGLSFVRPGEWLTAVYVYTLGVLGFTMALTFYDALIVNVASPSQVDRVSGLGYGLGYLGGGLLFLVNVLMYQSPQWFGLTDGTAGILWSFVSVGIWWLLFSMPLFFWVPETSPTVRRGLSDSIRQGFAGLYQHVKILINQRSLLYFLIGYLFYIDGVNTIVKMAVDYGMSVGLEPSDLIKALLMVQFIGFPAAIIFGILGEKFGPRLGIWICLVAYFFVTIFAYRLETAADFYVFAAVIGLVQGGIQSLSRSYFARLVPINESAQYFGFFNMVGKFSSILGPLLVGSVGLWLNNSRAGILVLVLFFIAGGIFLSMSREEEFRQ